MSFASVCIINEPLCFPVGANRNRVKAGSGTGYMEAVENPKAVIISVQLHTDWLLCYTDSKRRGRSRKRPPSPAEYKEAHRASSNMVAYHLCILSWSALDFHRILCIWNQTLSQCCLAKSEGCRYISYFRIVEMKLISLVHRLSHKVIFLFCVWILPNPLLQIWNLPPHHFSLPTGFPCATLVAFFPLAFLAASSQSMQLICISITGVTANANPNFFLLLLLHIKNF